MLKHCPWRRVSPRDTCSFVAFLAILLALIAVAVHGFHAIRLQSERCNLDATLEAQEHRNPDADCRRSFSLLGGRSGEQVAVLGVRCLGLLTASARLLMLAAGCLPAACRAFRRKQSGRLLRACAADLSRAAHGAFRAVFQCWLEVEEARAWREATQSRVEQARAYMHRISLMTVPLLLVYVCGPGVWRADDGEAPGGMWLGYLYESGAVPVLCIAIISTLLSAVPSATSPRSLNLVNMFMSAVWCWKLAVMRRDHFPYNETWILFSCLIQGIVCGNAPLTIFLHAMVMAVCAFAFDGQPDQSDLHGRPHPELQLATFFMMSVLIWSFEQWRLAEARAVICSKRSSHASALVYGVLRGMSDAVVKLDVDLRLLEPSEELAALLLRRGPRIPGRSFTDFMAAGDAEHLRKHFAFWPDGDQVGDTDPAKMTHALHLNLMDGNNARLPVELFYSCVPDFDGQPTYLVGIKEDREQSWTGGPGARDCPRPHELAPLPEAGRVRHGVATSSWSNSDTEDGDWEDVHLWVDAASADIRVLSFSGSFALLGGASGPCGALREWMSQADLASFGAWLAEPQAPCTITLRPPASRGEYTVNCALVREPGCAPPAGPSNAEPRCISLAISPFKAHRVSGEAGVLRDPQKVRGRHAAAARAPKSQPESQHAESEADVALWLSLSHSMMILDISGSNEAYRSLFSVNAYLSDWLERPRDFMDRMRQALLQSDDLPLVMGSFVLTRPPGTEPAVKFLAELSLLGVSDEEAADFPCCVGLRPLRALAAPAGALPAPGAEVAARVVGRPSALAL